MPLNSDSVIAKKDRLMMPYYKTAKTDWPQAYSITKYITYITEIVLDLENKVELELGYHYNVKVKHL